MTDSKADRITEPSAANPKREPCRTCGKAVGKAEETYPFCSGRCRMADLGKWFSGEYTISRPIEQRDIEDGE